MFEDNHTAVRANRRKPHVATLKRSNLVSFAAAVGDPPNICEPATVAIADKIYATVFAPHGPRIQAVEISQLRKLFSRDIFDPNIRRISAAIILAPVNLALRVVSDALAVRRKTRRITHVRTCAPR